MVFTTLFSLIYFCKLPLFCIYIDLGKGNVYSVMGVAARIEKVLWWGVDGLLARVSYAASVALGTYVFLE